MDLTTFRTNFPEFANTTTFPDAIFAVWSGIGAQVISQDRWGDLYDTAVYLFTAHNLVLAGGNVAEVAAGGLPGGKGGAQSQKSVGSVSVNYDTPSSMELNAGHWNQTIYGRQYIQLARLMGGGCRQL